MAHSSLLNVDSAQKTKVEQSTKSISPNTRSIAHFSSSVVETDLARGFKVSSGAQPHTLGQNITVAGVWLRTTLHLTADRKQREENRNRLGTAQEHGPSNQYFPVRFYLLQFPEHSKLTLPTENEVPTHEALRWMRHRQPVLSDGLLSPAKSCC